jgi:hypothetical protein
MPDDHSIEDLEALKQLKARYCRLLDMKQWFEWRKLFAENFVSDTSEAGGRQIEGADEFVSFVRKMLGTRITVHQIHAPEIELTSATTAHGIWALEDIIRFAPGLNLRGYGHYHESYEKFEGQWRFKSSKLTRLREDIVTPIFSITVPDWLRNRISKAASV